MFDFRSDCSFHVIDLVSLSDQLLTICTVMLQEMVDLFVQGKLKPIEPTVAYEPSQVVEAFMKCNSGQALGKTIIRLSSSDSPLYLHRKQDSHLSDGNTFLFFCSTSQK